MDEIKLSKVDHVKFFIRALVIILIIIIFSIFAKAFEMGINSNHEFELIGKTFFSEDTSMIYQFNANNKGEYTHYEITEEAESKESKVDDIQLFTYSIDTEKYTVDITFTEEVKETYYFINNALFNTATSLYLYELN